MAFKIEDLVAPIGFAPRDWQNPAPSESYGGGPPVGDSDELQRIVALPRRPQEIEGSPRAEAIIETMTARYARPVGPCRCAEYVKPPRPCLTRLRFAQAWALREISIAGGLLAPIGVGHGKTLLDVLGILAFEPFGVRLGLLLVPPTLVTQLVDDYIAIGQHFRVPSVVVHSGSGYSAILPGQPVLHVLPYSLLSRPDASTWIENLRPQVVIADEVHKLRDPDTATTSRVLRYFDHHPETRFAGWSGSVTDKTIRDYAHLAKMALKHLSPLPRDPEIVDDWSRALDPKDNPADAGALFALCAPGESVIDGFRRRFNETCGVVATTEASVDIELSIEERKPARIETEHDLPPAIRSALAQIRSGERPDGDVLPDALAEAKCALEIASGFYYRWIFPRGEPYELIEEWRDARKAWGKELREKLKDRAPHLDSPILCQHAAERAHGGRVQNDALPSWLARSWPRWRDIKSQVEPETEAVRVDDYLARDAAEWALQNRGIVWYEHVEFGSWVAEISGLPMHTGGPKAGARLKDELKKYRGSRSIVCSIKSHGTGRDGLQEAFADNLVGNPPSSPTAWEQLLGRTHRVRQTAPIVRARFYRHTTELRRHVDDALRAALYVEGTIGARQKLRLGFGL